MNNQSSIFALDIGTRSVIGIILQENTNGYEVVDFEIIEHDERAMLDGQIHDVLAVSKVIQEIKSILEERNGKLHKVCVAAAGRALKTKKSKVSIEISGKPIINTQDIIHLELSAVQQAQKEIAAENGVVESSHYYCVGYSVLRYLLDEDGIGSLVDQQGDQASVEIIATFLPKIVVESLIAAINRADLEMEALTLEPIASIHVLIPPSMRRLNVALVDIGAGTSDIAITDEGTVVAYGMVPIAGDEITEAISDQYLLDFPLAEDAKRNLNTNEEIIVTDILGFDTIIPKSDMITTIYDSIDKLATAISNEILALNNNKEPKAVMLVGGGSLTPELPTLVATKLGLPENRVAIRGIDAIQKLTLPDHIKQGPELVTPIGIGIAARLSPIHYITVNVNGRSVRLFDMREITVGDCLLAAGIEMNKLYGKPGMAMIVSINGRDITIPGLHGGSPTLLKEGVATSFNDLVNSGDSIIVEKGVDGIPASPQIKDLLEVSPSKQIWINEQPYQLEMKITNNGNRATLDSIIKDHDKIETILPKTIADVLETLNIHGETSSFEPFYVNYNRGKVVLPKFQTKLLKNGLEVKQNALVNDGDKITTIDSNRPTLKDLLEEKEISLHHKIPVFFNGEPVTLQKPNLDIVRNDEVLNEDSPLNRGDHLKAIEKGADPFIFQDVFRFVDIKMPQTQTVNFTILKNGEETTFYDTLAPGDVLSIEWSEITTLN